MAQVLIKGGRIITAVDDYQAGILISDGRIEAIGVMELHLPDQPLRHIAVAPY